jgi:RNA polymerase sigma-70 factor (ECF subfamily)
MDDEASGRDEDHAALYRRYAPLVHRRALRLLGDEQAAWDAVQEVFLRVLRSHFREESSPMTWLYRITTNHCFNLLRNAARRARRTEQYLKVPVAGLASESPAEARIAVAQLVSRLPPKLFEVAVYAYLDRMTQEEIAEVVDVSRKTVNHRLRELRERVAAMTTQPIEVLA